MTKSVLLLSLITKRRDVGSPSQTTRAERREENRAEGHNSNQRMENQQYGKKRSRKSLF